MSFAIYDLEEDIRKLLTVDNFLNGLTVNEFIEELSKDHILKGAEVNNLEYLDPKPYIRTFESTLRYLKQLAEEAKEINVRAEKDVEEFELLHSRSVLELSTNVEQIVSKFDHLDVEISSISKKIAPLNLQLNIISNLRDRSLQTIALVRAYHGFYTKEKYEPLDSLKRSKDIEEKIKAVKTVSNLLTLAKKIQVATGNLPKVTKAVNTIEKYSETTEREFLQKFSLASDDSDFDEMKANAKILFEFNGGDSLVQTFMSKADIFFAADQEEEGTVSLIEDEAVWTKVADPLYLPHEFFREVSSRLYLDRLKVAIKAQARIVQLVFDEPTAVIKIMIQRVYAQILQNKVSALLSYSQQTTNLAHLRLLHALYVLIGELTRDMKEFFTTNDFDEEGEISGTLDQCLYDLFIEYLNESAHFSLEKEMLETVIFDIAQIFTTLNERALSKKALEEKLDELEEGAAMPAMNSPSRPTQDKKFFRFVEKRRLNKFKDFMRTHITQRVQGRDSIDPNDYAEFGTLNIGKVQIVLRLVIEAISRVIELAPSKTPEHSLELLEILLLDFGGLYVAGALEVAYDRAEQSLANLAQNTDPNFAFMQIFGKTSEILYLLSSCIKRILLPCAVNNPTIRNRMISLTNNYISRCEMSINLILEKVIEIITANLNQHLQKQKKKDFVCEAIDTNQDYTETCELISDFLIHIHGVLKTHLKNENLNNTLTRIGVINLNLLLDHFKRYNVNSTGGIILTQDVIRYQSVIDSWEIPQLSESYQILREISNLFTVQPNLLNSLITEGHLASLKAYTVRQYISKRTDFSPSFFERFFGRK